MYKRQHPITILLSIRISGLFPFILLVIFRSDENEPWYLFYFVLLFLLFVMAIFSAVKWYFKVYWIENNILHIKHGVFVKKESYLNKERVQNVSTSSNIIYQILGLPKLNIEVAGGGSEPEVMLAGIKEDEAKALIALLHKERSVVAEEVPAEEGSKTVYQLKAKEILFASITSGRFGLVFSMLVILYTEFNQFLPEWFINKVEAYVMDNGVYELIVMAAILMAISWVISTAGYALKYANFKIERNGNEIRIVQGLFDKKEFVLKLHRIQAITVKEGILRQPFGYCSVEVEVIQSIESAGNEVMLHPFMKKKMCSSYSHIYSCRMKWKRKSFIYRKRHCAVTSSWAGLQLLCSLCRSLVRVYISNNISRYSLLSRYVSDLQYSHTLVILAAVI